MKRPFVIATCSLALAGALSLPPVAPAAAQSQAVQAKAVATRTFAIDNMTCALCPVTVKTAIEHVDGVRSVTVDFASKTATVTFDPAVASPAAIAAASSNAGYPARPAG